MNVKTTLLYNYDPEQGLIGRLASDLTIFTQEDGSLYAETMLYCHSDAQYEDVSLEALKESALAIDLRFCGSATDNAMKRFKQDSLLFLLPESIDFYVYQFNGVSQQRVVATVRNLNSYLRLKRATIRERKMRQWNGNRAINTV